VCLKIASVKIKAEVAAEARKAAVDLLVWCSNQASVNINTICLPQYF